LVGMSEPIDRHYWGSCGDRFGTQWMFNVSPG
jgi:uncharacterized glyoxalase superfamily protein PhnB